MAEGGKKAHQRALAQITVHYTANLLKDFTKERHIVLEGPADHIIGADLYTLAAHEHHWNHTTNSAMHPASQGTKDHLTPIHIAQLLHCRATPHLNPSRMEKAFAPRDTLDAPTQTSRRPHPQSGRPMVGPPLGT